MIDKSSVWWLRSPNVNNANNVYNVSASGTQNNNNANNTYGVSLDYINEFIENSLESKHQSNAETKQKCKESLTLPHINKAANRNRRREHRNYYDVLTISSDIFSFENIVKAIKSCAKGVSWKNSVMKWKIDTINLAQSLYKKLHNGTYHLSSYMTFKIFYPKQRVIKSLLFADRVVQRVMCFSGLYHDLTRSNIYDNGACQVHKGTTFAIDRMKVLLMKYYKKHGNHGWVLKLDIHKFFESIPHDKLKEMVHKKVKDKMIGQMVCDIIDSFDGDRGIGLGSQTSQLLAISFLSDFDHFLKQKCHIKYYIRYSDDMILIHPDKNYLKTIKTIARQKLNQLGLELNPKSNISKLEHGFEFLKFRYILKDTGKVIIMPVKRKFAQMKRKIKKMIKKDVDNLEIIQSFISWASFLLQGNVRQRIYKIQQFINENIK